MSYQFIEILGPTLANTHIRIHAPQNRTKGDCVSFHIHEEATFILIQSGLFLLEIHDKAYHLTQGDVFFVNEGIPYQTTMETDCKFLLVQANIDFEFTGKLRSEFRCLTHMDQDFAYYPNQSEIATILGESLKNIVKENTEKKEGYSVFIKSELLKIHAILYREGILQFPNETIEKSFRKLAPILNYIEDHYNEPITLETITKMFNIEKTYFCKFFKTNMNATFTQYLNTVRINKAKTLMLSANKSITEIAAETGFSSSSYFAEIFKRNVHCTPNQYQKIKKNADGKSILVKS